MFFLGLKHQPLGRETLRRFARARSLSPDIDICSFRHAVDYILIPDASVRCWNYFCLHNKMIFRASSNRRPVSETTSTLPILRDPSSMPLYTIQRIKIVFPASAMYLSNFINTIPQTAGQGLEPQYPPPKGGVLPLDEPAMLYILPYFPSDFNCPCVVSTTASSSGRCGTAA